MEKNQKGKNCIKELFLQTILPAVALVLAVNLAVVPSGCRSSIEGADFLTGDFTLPHIEEVKVESKTSVAMNFSKQVTVNRASLTQDSSPMSENLKSELSEDGRTVHFVCTDDMITGEHYILDAEIQDPHGNTLTISVTFPGFNDRVPDLRLSEIRIKNKSSKADESARKSEFVELYAKTAGNLSGLEIFNAEDGEEKKYSFPPIEVKAGEYIVVHYRNDATGCINETGENLSEATAADCQNTARDLFVDNESEGRFGANADIVILRNSADGAILDAFAYANREKVSDWNDKLKPYAQVLEENLMWTDSSGTSSCTPESAFDGTSLNKEAHSVCRKNAIANGDLNHSNTGWYEITATKMQSPGLPNKVK
ncbi:MAG: hypothetical protein J5930_02300 [Treponema sp.]|nr:hypothetical protein [Treponema sp.]